jgi:hypothetical protein
VVLGRRGHIGEGKKRFIKGDMARDDDMVCVEITTLITLMISGVSQEHTEWIEVKVYVELWMIGWDSKHSQKRVSDHT